MSKSSTEARHRAVLTLRPEAPDAVQALMGFLGDPSWRVRKAALGRIDDFRSRPTLLVELIEGLGDDTNAGLRGACSEALLRMGESVEALIEALRTPNVNQRKIVAEILGSMGTQVARERLVALLQDPDPNSRAAAAEALGRIGGDDAIAALRHRLQTSAADLQQSTYLLDALGRAGSRLDYGELEPWIAQRAVQRPLLLLLALSGDVRAVPALVVGITAGSTGTRHAAVRAVHRGLAGMSAEARQALLEALAPGSAGRSALLSSLSDEEDDVALGAVQILAATGDPEVGLPILVACACRSFLRHGLEAVNGLGSGVAAPLLAGLSDLDTDARVLALETLELLGDATALPLCIEIASGEEPRAGEAAVRVLGAHGDPSVLECLVRLARGGTDLRAPAALALANLAARHPDAVCDRALAEMGDGCREWPWPYVLGRVARPKDYDAVRAAITSTNADVRAAALHAAINFRRPESRQDYLRSLTDDEPVVRAAAARALGHCPGHDSLERLLDVLSDEDVWTVAEALWSLGELGGPRAIGALQEAIGREASPIVIAAMQALARLNPAALEVSIRGLLSHPDPEVVREALQATSPLGDDLAESILLSQLSHDNWDVRREAATIMLERGIRLPRHLWQQTMALETEPLVRRVLEQLVVGGGRSG